MTIEEQVNEGIKNAMKAQDKIRLETMRNIKKVILEAKTRPGAGDHIEDGECIKLIQKLANRDVNLPVFIKDRGVRIFMHRKWGKWPFWKNFYPSN